MLTRNEFVSVSVEMPLVGYQNEGMRAKYDVAYIVCVHYGNISKISEVSNVSLK